MQGQRFRFRVFLESITCQTLKQQEDGYQFHSTFLLTTALVMSPVQKHKAYSHVNQIKRQLSLFSSRFCHLLVLAVAE